MPGSGSGIRIGEKILDPAPLPLQCRYDLLLLDVDGVGAGVELLVAELVEAGEGDPQVGGLEQVLHLLAVRVEIRRVDLHVGRQGPENDLHICGHCIKGTVQ